MAEETKVEEKVEEKQKPQQLRLKKQKPKKLSRILFSAPLS